MPTILCEHNPSPAKLDVLGVPDWPTWKKEASRFAWTYSATETCYIVSGRAIITPETGEPVEIKAGDLVSFPAGLNCTWDILEDIEKHHDSRK